MEKGMKLLIINLDQIIVGDRFRKEMGDIEGLAIDIDEKGLIQPLAVKETEEDGKFTLIAGERRLKAIISRKHETVPVRVYPSNLSKLQIRSIELSENLFRKEMTWLERCNLEREIHELEIEIHGEKISTSKDAAGVSMADTAMKLGISKSKLRISKQLSEIAERHPNLFKDIKTQDEAMKLISKLGSAIIRQEAAAEFDSRVPKDSVKKFLADKFMVNDFFIGVRNVPDCSIDIVEIDPPYSIALTDIKKGYNDIEESYNEIPSDKYIDFLYKTFTECYRVMASDSWLLCWFGPEPWFETVATLLDKTGFFVRRIPCIWTKPGGQTNSPQYHLANTYEMFFYARKGHATIAKQGRSNRFDFDPISPSQKSHPTERPIEMMQEILSTFGNEGSRVLVPFLGSGNTILAAYLNKMDGFGFELSQRYKDSFLVKLAKMNI